MRFEPGYLLGMAMQSIPEPRKIARELFALNLDRATLWQILILLMVIGAILGVGSSVLFPPAPELEGTIFAMPLIVAMAEASIAVITVFLIYWLGRSAGGTGRFEDGIVTVAWLNFVLLIVQTVVLVLSLFAPSLAALLWLFGGFTGFWILSHFIAELHGFASALRVFLTILLTSFIAVAILSIILAILGVGAAMTSGELGNV
ncbi:MULTISPECIES: Yip1 family protein [Maritimibacter]|uniref:Yip1 family protein n=1 Tax=Maritimibacter TaxID=404235 RepID=UPI001107FE26|nr:MULTISPECIES: Yip1 family protein [Maritimibacter]MBL6429581.1 YIP1 family protein [Maritimibacter sp.]